VLRVNHIHLVWHLFCALAKKHIKVFVSSKRYVRFWEQIIDGIGEKSYVTLCIGTYSFNKTEVRILLLPQKVDIISARPDNNQESTCIRKQIWSNNQEH
jgi:hypothetical protein